MRTPPSLPYALLAAGLFLTLGLYLPFFPLFLKARGLSAPEIGLILALPAWIRIVTTPGFAALADRSERTRDLVLLLAIGTCLAFVSLAWSFSFWAIALLHTLTGLLHQPQIPLADSLTLRAAAREGFDYGRARLWGSLAFILGTLGGGLYLAGHGADSLIWLLSLATLGTALAVLLIPREALPERRPRRLAGFALLRDPLFVLFVAGGALLQGSHAVYYGFSSLYWKSLGLGETTIGWLWAVGVLAEVVAFWFGRQLIGRCGPLRLMLLAAAGGCLRWPLLGMIEDPVLLAPIQVLHGLTFGFAHLGAVHFIARHAAPGQAATAQALYSTVVGSLGIGSLMYLSGGLYEAFAGRAYFAMAAVSAAGGIAVIALRRLERHKNAHD